MSEVRYTTVVVAYERAPLVRTRRHAPEQKTFVGIEREFGIPAQYWLEFGDDMSLSLCLPSWTGWRRRSTSCGACPPVRSRARRP